MNQQDYYANQLRMAREKKKNSPEEKAKEHLKKEIKRQALIWFCTFVLPWILLIGGILFVVGIMWFMACDNSMSSMKGWVISKLLKSKGLCPF